MITAMGWMSFEMIGYIKLATASREEGAPALRLELCPSSAVNFRG
jgi:hypothetical protein